MQREVALLAVLEEAVREAVEAVEELEVAEAEANQ